MSGDSPLSDPLGHSTDSDVFHFPGHREFNVHEWSRGFLGDTLNFWPLNINGLSKFMALEVLATVLLLAFAYYCGRKIVRKGYAKGVIVNFFEAMLVFIRDKVAIPAIGEHHAHHFLPYLWSVFFFILVNNLLGIVPNLGSATGALGCTGALAFCTFIVIHASGIKELGLSGYAHAFVPTVPLPLYFLMLPIEIIGALIKPAVLAVRLFVNMLAGHTVLYVIISFIAVAGPGLLWFVVTPASVLGNVLLNCLELFVAFLQAFVFTFLSAIFIGAAVHPHH